MYKLSFSPRYIASLVTGTSPSWAYIDGNMTSYAESLSSDQAEQANLRALVAVLVSEERSFRPLIGNSIVDSLI